MTEELIRLRQGFGGQVLESVKPRRFVLRGHAPLRS